MRVKLFAATLITAIFPIAWAQGPRTEEVKELHKDTSTAVIKDPGALDNTVPDDLQRRFDNFIGRSQKRLTYREVLSRSEQILQRSITTVKVVVDAAPKNCPVKYRPIAGGGSLDFGTTKATRNLAPATYEFTCQCTEKNTSKKIMECTEDTNVDFECKR